MVAGLPKVIFRCLLLIYLEGNDFSTSRCCLTIKNQFSIGVLPSIHSLFAVHSYSKSPLSMSVCLRSRNAYVVFRAKALKPAALDRVFYLLLSGAFLTHLGLGEDLGVIVSNLSKIVPNLQSRPSKCTFTRSNRTARTKKHHYLLTALCL